MAARSENLSWQRRLPARDSADR